MAEELLTKVYDPSETESKWYSVWESRGYFTSKIDLDKEPFTIVIPPPNVTGSLHMGHALNNTIQDVVVRRRRMQGQATLWLPGTDHAGIATQNKVEQQLETEGLTRQDVGREEFIERVWKWKEEYGATIINQLKRLGCSCDWSRERFTMDEGYSKAVKEVFVRLYRDGLIYRGHRIINWCPRCHTALSDIEVDHHDVEGGLWHIRYGLADKTGHLVIATTRPETLLGDTAIAVHPEDDRYKHLIGKEAVLPLVGRRLPIVGDEHVDPAFGTGALKVTPAHDPNDFEIGERHNLEQVNIFGPDAHINENGGKFAGMQRFEAREAVVGALTKEGLLEKYETHIHAVGHCYRCHTVIEPYLSEQWFVDMKPLAGPAIEAVKNGEVVFSPERWGRVYFEWMENIRDWCISRQIWWGHQIPAWYCLACGETVVDTHAPESCPKCGKTELEQDPDVLDTWFSSALWPFATLGWPDDTDDLDYFYPTSILSTARDILYLWVARMIMSGIKFVGQVPFHTVIIHPTVLNKEGRRMSKSLGTGIDPLELIDKYGTDATRFGLMVQATTMQDMRFTEEKLEMSRNFANKIWNASRFVLMNIDDADKQAIQGGLGALSADELSLPDRWILSRCQKLIGAVSASLDEYDFGGASRHLYDFFWSEFCDWYLELAKPKLYIEVESEEPGIDQSGAAHDQLMTKVVLVKVLDTTLRLLHPFMPFITEELWQAVREKSFDAGESLMIADWPIDAVALIDEEAEKEIDLLQKVVTSVRTIRAEHKVPPATKILVLVTAKDEAALKTVVDGQELITRLAGISELQTGVNIDRPQKSAMAVVGAVEVYIPLTGLVDVKKETDRLNKDLDRLEQDIAKIGKKLANDGFIKKAPAEVVEKQKNKRDELNERRLKINEQLNILSQ
ncbi:MAG TPA: valine--tRNA ligase [Actinobacteria bacterium]|nr:valine--tRNA ligase [Actinomycetota bacterium]